MDKPLSTLDTIRKIALALAGWKRVRLTAHQPPVVRKEFLCRRWEDGETLVVKVDFDTREVLLQADPAVFFTTPHYDGYPSVLVRLPAIHAEKLRKVLGTAWRIHAPRKLAALKP